MLNLKKMLKLWKTDPKKSKLPDEVKYLKKEIKLELEIDGIEIYITDLFYNKSKKAIECKFISPNKKYSEYVDTNEFKSKVQDCLNLIASKGEL